MFCIVLGEGFRDKGRVGFGADVLHTEKVISADVRVRARIEERTTPPFLSIRVLPAQG